MLVKCITFIFLLYILVNNSGKNCNREIEESNQNTGTPCDYYLMVMANVKCN